MKVMCVFGTRPEAIKMGPVVKAIEATEGMVSIVCVTAQHREMLDQVLEVFEITPDYDLNIMKQQQTLTGITTRAMTGLEAVILEARPDVVLVHGDTTTTFAGALAAFYHKIPVGHVEAGLRTYDVYQPFPEEINRQITSRLASYHFAPTKTAKENLLKEQVDSKRITVTGNTVIDALKSTIDEGHQFSVECLNTLDYKGKKIIAMTAHRRENLGEPLREICQAVLELVENYSDVEVVYAVHLNPLVQKTAEEILGKHPRIHLVAPLNLKDMHNLLARVYLVLTDSGGLQEEVPSLGKPVLVLRDVTERPEGVVAGTLKLVGTNREKIVREAGRLLMDQQAYEKMATATNPYGDGHAAQRIVDWLKENYIEKV